MNQNEKKESLWKKRGLTLRRHFHFSTETMRKKALSAPDYDPARLFKWGQMMALAVARMMDAAEERLGQEAQKVLTGALVDLGKEIGREVLEGLQIEPGVSEIEAVSAFITYVNEEIWASPEVPQVIDERTCVCDVIWCPHQDHYRAFDCRVQRYIVQGLLEALEERTGMRVDARFTQLIPKGAETCRFEIWKLGPNEAREWTSYSEQLANRALERARSRGA